MGQPLIWVEVKLVWWCDILASPLSVPDAVDFGLKCTACPFPFAAIKFFSARLHARRVGIAFDLCIANVAKNLQVVDSVGSAHALRDNVINLQ